MTSHDTIRTSAQLLDPPPPPGDLAQDIASPSALTPRTAAQVSRAHALGAAIRRYLTALAALLGGLGLGGLSVASAAANGQSPAEWVQRYGTWGAIALLLISAWEAHQKRRSDQGAAALVALERRAEAAERRADQQAELLEARAEAREQRSQEVIEMILDRHAAHLGELRDEVRGLRDDVAGLREATGQHRKLSTPPTPRAGAGRG